MVPVMVGRQNLGQFYLALLDCFCNELRIYWVNNCSLFCLVINNLFKKKMIKIDLYEKYERKSVFLITRYIKLSPRAGRTSTIIPGLVNFVLVLWSLVATSLTIFFAKNISIFIYFLLLCFIINLL